MITMTDLASRKTKSSLEKRGNGLGIRVGVKTTGCSGLAYVLEYVDTPLETDTIYESNGVKIFVDPKNIPYLEGMTIDWKRNGLNEGFDFINSLEKARCGCGESFTV
jgi:iron-sulfur cluster assembly protein